MTEYVRLGDVAKLINGRAYSQSELLDSGKYPVLRVGNFFSNSNWYYSDLELNPEKYCDNGDLLYAWSASFGAKIWSGGKVIFHYHIWKIILSEKINREYLYHYLNYQSKRLKDGGHGSSMIHLTKSDMENHIFPLPPLEEQKRIAAALDKMSSVIAKRKRQIALLDEAAKSLFVEMFGDPVENPMGWEEVSLSKCLDSIENGKSFVCDSEKRKGTAPAVLKLSAATYGYYQPEENKAIISESQFIAKAEVHAGDLLFTRKNTPELVGMCAYVFSTPEKLMMPDLIFRLNTNSHCNKLFLWMLINHDLFREKIRCLASGSAKSMSNISKKSLNNLEIPLPPLDLQNLFAARIEALEAQRASCERGLKQMETAFAAMMQEYFG